jgi:hypothetical protein
MKLSVLLLSLLTLSSCGGYMYPDKWEKISALCVANGGVDHVYSVAVGKDEVLCKNKAAFKVFYTSAKVLEVY